MRVAVAAVLAVLLLAGCGGGDVEKSNAYVESVNIAQTQFASSFERLAREITSTSTPAQDRKTLRSIGAALESTVADLRKIVPPDKAKAEHAQLVEALSEYDTAIATAEPKLGGSAAQATAAQEQLKADTDATSARVNAAIAAINQKLRD